MIHRFYMSERLAFVWGGGWGGKEDGDIVGRLPDLDCIDPKESCFYPAPTPLFHPTHLQHLVCLILSSFICTAHPRLLDLILLLHLISVPLTSSFFTTSLPFRSLRQSSSYLPCSFPLLVSLTLSYTLALASPLDLLPSL